MTSNELVAILNEWSATGGNLLDSLPTHHSVTTAQEADAICRALGSAHIYQTINSIQTPALHSLAALCQSIESEEAARILRDNGLRHVRRILVDALDHPDATDLDSWGLDQRKEAQLFLLKILAMLGQTGDGRIIVKAARNPRMAAGYWWSMIFDSVCDSHPDAMDILEGLRDPLPSGPMGVAYMTFVNRLALENRITAHPYDTDAGIACLQAYLTDPDPEHYDYAVSATAALPFLKSHASSALQASADQHPDPIVRLEAAWALAKAGSKFGRHRLAQLCLNPRFSERAIFYLEELGFAADIPSRARDPDFQAIAAMCSWLMHPNEFGRPPDEISQYDARELYWPPTGDKRRVWLFKYRYRPHEHDSSVNEGIGMVGSVTFALFGETTSDMLPADAYALHCCWELQMSEDPRVGEQLDLAMGKQILAEANPGFA